MRRSLLLAALALAPGLARADGELRPFVDLETGAVWVSRNDVQVPGRTGTRFSLGSGGDFSRGTAPYVRAAIGAVLGRHTLRATFAPLRLRGNGTSNASILFRDVAFTAGGDASVLYRFDTYRLTYRYALVASESFDVAVGATALIRDAEIRLSQGGLSTSERNTGFVPLVSLRAAWRMGGGPFALSVDGDALAAPQGRAEDVALALEFATGDLTFRAGYRVLEGGADNHTVYNFAWLNHAMAGVNYRF